MRSMKTENYNSLKINSSCNLISFLYQNMLYYRGPYPPGSQTGTSPWPVRNQATQQEVSGG